MASNDTRLLLQALNRIGNLILWHARLTRTALHTSHADKEGLDQCLTTMEAQVLFLRDIEREAFK